MSARTSITLIAIVSLLVLAAGLAAVAQEASPSPSGAEADPGTSQVMASRSNADGQLVKGVALAGNKLNDGHFWVRFPIDVSGCLFSATLTQKKMVRTNDDPGMITAQPRSTDPREILITTFNQFGNLNDHGFDVIVACPEPAA